MSVRLLPGFVAVLVGVVLVALLFVPYVFGAYRRRGELGWGRALLAGASLVYALGLVAYVLLPLPAADADLCTGGVALAGPQWTPLGFVADAAGYDELNPLRNPATLQVLLNVALFVPLGAFVRYLGRRSVLTTVLIGLAVSGFVEVTQLTGNWFLYPCPYRLFDVDDLLANGLGALMGAWAAPLLRFVPGQRIEHDPDLPRPVSRRRRLLGAVCDLVSVWLVGALLAAVPLAGVLVVRGDLIDPPGWLATAQTVLGTWVPVLVLFVVLPLLGRGGTPGQRAVLLRPALADGGVPPRALLLARSLTGTGGYLVLQAAEVPFAGLWGVVGLFGILFVTAEHRGIGGVLTGTWLVDRRGDAVAESRRRAAVGPG